MKRIFLATLLLFATTAYSETAPYITILTDVPFEESTIIKRFTEETGIEVRFMPMLPRKEFRIMTTKKQVKGYDMAIISGVETEIFTTNNLIAELNLKKLPNLQYIDERYTTNRNISFYSIPLEIIYMGLCFNSKFITSAEGKTYATLVDPHFKNKIYNTPSVRIQFFQMLQYLGYSGNTDNEYEISDAYQYVSLLSNNSIDSNDTNVVSMLANNEVYISFVTGATCYKAGLLNHNIQFMIPQEGGLRTTTEMSMFKSTEKAYEVYQLMNFLMRPDIAPKLTEELHVATTNLFGMKLIMPSLKHNVMIFPVTNINKIEEYKVVPSATSIYDAYTEAFKKDKALHK